MQPGLHSWSFRKEFERENPIDIFHVIDRAAAMGFSVLEVMTGKAAMPPTHVGTESAEGLRRVLRYAEDHGVVIHCYATYNDFAYVKDEEWRKANIGYIKTWLRLAGETGVPNLRMLTGYYIEGEDRQRLEDLTRAGIEECIPVAEEAGVNLAIENHNSIFFSGREIAALIEHFGSSRLTACPDPTNGYAVFAPDCPPETVEAMYENATVLAPLATDSHLKIRGFDDEGHLLGLDLDRLLRIYRDAGYDGPIMFESVADGDLTAPLPRARQLLQEAIDRVEATV